MKKLITYLESESDLNHLVDLRNQGVSVEVILGCRDISRFAKNSLEDLMKLVNLLRDEKMNFSLEWDVLNQEKKFLQSLKIIDQLLLLDFRSIRVQDPGAVEYIKSKYPGIKIELILENGNHNLPAICGWIEYLGEQCSKIVLSNELSKEMLKKYATIIRVPIEVQVLGRILLFYSPRLLLSPLEKNELNEVLEAYGTSEESPHSGFPIIENRHGTFMFNVKDLSLLENIIELEAMGIFEYRLDLRFDYTIEKWKSFICPFFISNEENSFNQLKLNHPRPFIKGFYNINKSDVLFTKLKNKRIQRSDKDYLGEIVDVEKDLQLAFLVKSSNKKIISGALVKIVTPEGKIKQFELKWIKNSSGELVDEILENDLILIPYINGVTVKSQVYLGSKI